MTGSHSVSPDHTLTPFLPVWYENCNANLVSDGLEGKMHQSSERIKPEEFRQWNERMLEKYDPDAFHHHSNSFVRFIERTRVKAIFKVIDIRREDCVIEIGCGAGNVIEKTSGCKLFGADISSSVLRKARQRLNERGAFVSGRCPNSPLQR